MQRSLRSTSLRRSLEEWQRRAYSQGVTASTETQDGPVSHFAQELDEHVSEQRAVLSAADKAFYAPPPGYDRRSEAARYGIGRLGQVVLPIELQEAVLQRLQGVWPRIPM